MPDFSVDPIEPDNELLVSRGGGALGWWRIRSSEPGAHPAARRLHDAFRFQSLQANHYHEVLKHLAAALRDLRIDVLLGKGLVASLNYPDPALRPSGDIDLYVRPEHFPQAYAAFDELNKAVSRTGLFCIDMHHGAPDFPDSSFEGLFRHSRLIEVVGIRTFGPEHHLALLCVHAMRHGMYRPLWLCDIAAAIEKCDEVFDWNIILTGNSRQIEWCKCAMMLAHDLLGARIHHLPREITSYRVPGWLSRQVLKQWGSTATPLGRRAPFMLHWRHRTGILNALRERWPNPIESTVRFNRSISELAPIHYQLADCAIRTARFALKGMNPENSSP